MRDAKTLPHTKLTKKEELIVVRPGLGANTIHLGQTESEVRNALGKPTKTIRKFENSFFYIYQEKGIDLDFGKRGGKLKVIFFFREGIQNHKGANVRTEQGIRLGDTRSKVLKLYGEPYEKGEPFILHNGDYFREWFYYSEGVQFRFDGEKRIDEISISKSKKKQT